MVAYSRKKSYARKRPAFRKSISRKRTTKSKVASNTAKINTLVNTMNNVAELKVQSLANSYHDSPSPVEPLPATGPLYYKNYCLGSPATTWTGPSGGAGFSGLAGFQWAQGTAPNQRVGRYLFLKHTSAQLRITMENAVVGGNAIQFRVIVYKAKRNSALGTSGGNPCDDLFLSNDGGIVGINTVMTNYARSFEYMNMLVNKRNYNCLLDKKFILQPELTAVMGSTSIVSPLSTNYPAEKTISLRLNHNAKTAFSTFNQPLDLNYQYCVSIIASPLGDPNGFASKWHSSMRGTVSCIDN